MISTNNRNASTWVFVTVVMRVRVFSGVNFFSCRQQLNAAWRDYEAECIEQEYRNEKKAAAREFEDKKIELKESLIHELEEKKKGIEHERYAMELTSDSTEVSRNVSKRILRRRPNEPVPIPDKRRKTPQSQITFLLDEKQIDDDLNLILQGTSTPPAYSRLG